MRPMGLRTLLRYQYRDAKRVTRRKKLPQNGTTLAVWRCGGVAVWRCGGVAGSPGRAARGEGGRGRGRPAARAAGGEGVGDYGRAVKRASSSASHT